MSCCDCLKIQVLDDVENVAASMLVGGKLFVDITKQDALEFSRKLSQLADVSNNIQDEASLSINLPYTDKNLAIASFVRDHGQTGVQFEPLAIIVQESGTVHHLNYLQFLGANDETQTFEARVERGQGHWLHDANRLLLKDLTFEPFTLTFENLLNNWETEAYFESSIDNLGYYWPLVNYGGWLAKNAVLPEDFRPWFHLYALLEKGFCEIGWKFQSPFYDTTFGRKLICYLLSENLLEVPEILALRKFKATVENSNLTVTGSGLARIIIFDTVEYDPAGNYSTTTGAFAATGIFTFATSLELTHDGPAGPLIVTLEKRSADGTLEELDQYLVDTSATQFEQTHIVNLEAEDVQMAAGDRVHVSMLALTPMVMTGYFTGFAQKAYLEAGQVIDNPAILISQELTLLDLYKAAKHICAGKTETLWPQRQIWLYAPNTADVFVDPDRQGYYTSDVVDISELIVERSEIVQLERENKKRYLVLQWADSNDVHVKKKEDAQTFPLFSKVVDRGSKYEEGYEYSKNPLFQATVNKELVKFPVVPPEIVANNEVQIPHCSDNDQDNISYKIGFRILHAHGYYFQETAAGDISRWRIETGGGNSTGMDKLPYAYMHPGEVLINSTFFGTPFAPIPRVIYGDEEDNDFYSIAYRQELIDRLYSVRSSFKAQLTAYLYQTLSFRDLYKVYYDGRTFLAHLLEINAQRTCSDEPAEIVLRPVIWGGDLCVEKDLVKYRPETCPNFPEIDIDIDVSADTITATANDAAIGDDILTDVWEYSTDGGENWSSYTPGTPIAAQGEVIFRRTVNFDADAGQCEKSITRKAVFEAVCSNKAGIELVYDDSKNAIVANAQDELNSTIDSDTWTVSIDDGPAQAYTEGDTVNGFTTVLFTRTVSFTNSCEDITVTAGRTVEGDQCNNTPALTLTEVAPCVFEPSISGTTSSTVCTTIFEVSNDAGSTWFPWDTYPIKGEPDKKVRASVYFCDNCPPLYLEQDCPF